MYATQVWLAVNHNTSILMENEFDGRSLLHGQVNLAAVNHICVIHGTMNAILLTCIKEINTIFGMFMES